MTDDEMDELAKEIVQYGLSGVKAAVPERYVLMTLRYANTLGYSLAPPGSVVVPAEPTEAMVCAGWYAASPHHEDPVCSEDLKPAYRAMIAAAGGDNGD